MKNSQIDSLVNFSRTKIRLMNFIYDIENTFGTMSISRDRNISTFFKRMMNIKNKDIREFDRTLDISMPPQFSLFGLGDHMDFFDHIDKFNVNGLPFVIVSQPYQVHQKHINEIKRLCDHFGAHLYVGVKGSGWRCLGEHLITISKVKIY